MHIYAYVFLPLNSKQPQVSAVNATSVFKYHENLAISPTQGQIYQAGSCSEITPVSQCPQTLPSVWVHLLPLNSDLVGIGTWLLFCGCTFLFLHLD